MPGTVAEDPERQRRFCQSSWHLLATTEETPPWPEVQLPAYGHAQQDQKPSGTSRKRALAKGQVCSNEGIRQVQRKGRVRREKPVDVTGSPSEAHQALLCAGPMLGTGSSKDPPQDLPLGGEDSMCCDRVTRKARQWAVGAQGVKAQCLGDLGTASERW